MPTSVLNEKTDNQVGVLRYGTLYAGTDQGFQLGKGRMKDVDGVAVVGCLMTLVPINSPFSANYNSYFIDLVQREYKSSIVYFC